MTPFSVVGDYQSVGESTDFSNVKQGVVSPAETSSLLTLIFALTLEWEIKFFNCGKNVY